MTLRKCSPSSCFWAAHRTCTLRQVQDCSEAAPAAAAAASDEPVRKRKGGARLSGQAAGKARCIAPSRPAAVANTGGSSVAPGSTHQTGALSQESCMDEPPWWPSVCGVISMRHAKARSAMDVHHADAVLKGCLPHEAEHSNLGAGSVVWVSMGPKTWPALVLSTAEKVGVMKSIQTLDNCHILLAAPGTNCFGPSLCRRMCSCLPRASRQP